MVALSDDEILAITGNLDVPTDSVTGQVLTEMTEEDVQNIIENI